MKLYSKRFHAVIGLVIVVGAMLFVITQLPGMDSPNSCRDSLRPTRAKLSSKGDLDAVLPLDNQTIPSLQRLALLDIGWIKNGNFQIHFSPDASMLAISGVGAANDFSGVFIWRLKQIPLCMFPLGDGVEYAPEQSFLGFSSDSKLALINILSLQGSNDGTVHSTLWELQSNRLVDRFYKAAFVTQGDSLYLQFQKKYNDPLEIYKQVWELTRQAPSAIETIISGTQVELVDSVTKNVLFPIEASGQVADTEISSDGKLLALATTRPNKFTPYYWDTFVELWGVVDATKREE